MLPVFVCAKFSANQSFLIYDAIPVNRQPASAAMVLVHCTRARFR